jgi:hypothetical protein
VDFQGAVEHEMRHLLGIMSAEYYRQGYEGNGLGYAYGNALFVLDLFQLDSDSPVAGPSDFAKARRNLDVNVSTFSSIVTATFPNPNEPNFQWIKYGSHDRVFVYTTGKGQFRSYPFMNYINMGNPDGDIQASIQKWLQYCVGCAHTDDNLVAMTTHFTAPYILQLPATYEVHGDQQSNSLAGTYDLASERDLKTLSALGYDVDLSYLNGDSNGPGATKKARTANWYLACFDPTTGEFLDGQMVATAHHGTQLCNYSVMPDYIDLFN